MKEVFASVTFESPDVSLLLHRDLTGDTVTLTIMRDGKKDARVSETGPGLEAFFGLRSS
jgi:hypothetical protein